MQSGERNFKKLGLICLIIVVLLVGPLIGFQIYQAKRFHLVRSIPDRTGAVSTAANIFELQFNRELKSGVNYATRLNDPGKIVKQISIKQKVMLLYVVHLNRDQRYSLSINNIEAADGSKIPSVDFSFTARFVPADKLPKEQLKQLQQQTDRGNIDDPILARLPYGGLHFSISSSFTANSNSAGGLVLDARLLLDKSDLSEKSAAIAKYKQQVIDYIKSLGLDPNKYTINYIVVEPSVF